MYKFLIDKPVSLDLQKTISKSDLNPLKGVGNGKIVLLYLKMKVFGKNIIFSVKSKCTGPIFG